MMPTLETVAGDATNRSSTSNIIVISLLILILSPDTKHNFLLSSKTVFMFSIQIASTGPSNMTHLRSLVVLAAACLYIVLMMPSCHSLVFGSNSPYIWPVLIDTVAKPP